MTTSRGQQIVLAARPKGKPEFFIYYDFAAEHYADFPREVTAGIARVAFATVRTSSTVSKARQAPSSECWRGATSAS